MKLRLTLLALFFSIFSFGIYANNLDTVAIALKKANQAPVTLTGTVIKALDNTNYIIQDTTGEIPIEIQLSDSEKVAFFKKYPRILNANITIKGDLYKKAFETTKVIVSQISVVNTSSYDPFINALSGNMSGVTSIKVVKGLQDKEYVVLYGKISQLINNKEFLLRDNEGNDIRVMLDLYNKNDINSFMKKAVQDDTVVLEGFLDKTFVEKIKFDANRIQIVTRSVNDPFAEVLNRSK